MHVYPSPHVERVPLQTPNVALEDLAVQPDLDEEQEEQGRAIAAAAPPRIYPYIMHLQAASQGQGRSQSVGHAGTSGS